MMHLNVHTKRFYFFFYFFDKEKTEVGSFSETYTSVPNLR